MAFAAVLAAGEHPAASDAFGLEPVAFLGYSQHHPGPLPELETSCWKEDQNSHHHSCFQTSSSDLFSQAKMDTVLVVTILLCWLEITDLIFVGITNQNCLNSDLFLCCQQKRWDSSLHITTALVATLVD